MTGIASEQPVAVSGLGSIGTQHVKALAAIGVTVIGFDPSDELRCRAAVLPGVTAVFGTFDELVRARPQALVIAAPDQFHLEQLEHATALGIPTLVEKPLAPSLPQAADSVRRIEARRVPVLIGYVLRHRKVTRTVRELLAAGAIGDPTTFQAMLGSYGTIIAAKSRFNEPEPDRLYRDYSHEWDYLRWFFGPVESVLAVARTVESVPHVERPNTVDALLRMRTGMSGAVHLDYLEPRGTRSVHILGTGGSLFADVVRGTVILRASNPADDRVIEQPQTPMEALQEQARHLLRVATGEDEPIVGLHDGMAALAVTEAVVRAAGSGRWEQVQQTAVVDGTK